MATFTRYLKVYEKHESTFLNLALIFYLCFGAFLFNQLNEFGTESDNVKRSSTTVNSNNNNKQTNYNVTSIGRGANGKISSSSLSELRLNSVRRMWNITNQLNILYESNWTLLVLDELVEFERRLLESLASSSELETSLELELELEVEEAEKRDKKTTLAPPGTVAGDKNVQTSSRSIKKSFLHSLATITTIGSPLGSPKSSTGKLVTILYGTLGIPLILFTVTKTGNNLAHSTLNAVLIFRHYCCSLPFHYLCCCCNLYTCFRWLAWCCCCCCCTYLCCLNSEDRNKAKCCDKKNAPKLRLKRVKQATSSSGASQRRPIDQLHFSNQQQKSVRFSSSGSGKDEARTSINDFMRQEQQKDNKDKYQTGSDQDDNLYSCGVFLTSLIILTVYLSAGAYFHSRNNSLTFVDGLFEVYALLSTSKMPDSLGGPKSSKPDLMSLYESLKSSSLTKAPSSNKASKTSSKHKIDPLGTEAFVLETLYLICGLHLLSMCGHFARLCMSGKLNQCKQLTLADCDYKKEPETSFKACNGHVPSVMGTLEGPANNSFGEFGQVVGNPSDHYLMQASLPSVHHISSSAVGEHQTNLQQRPGQGSDMSSSVQQQTPHQVNLSELFVVTSETASPADIHYTTGSGLDQTVFQQQQTSDVSFASDRSTDRASLCLHHQAQQMSSSATVQPSQATLCETNPVGSIYTHHQPYLSLERQNQHKHQYHHHNQPSSILLSGGKHRLGARNMLNDEGEGDEDDDEEEEMDQMLKNCLNGSNSKLTSSSSLLKLSQSARLSDTSSDNPHIHHYHRHNNNTFALNQHLAGARLRFGLDNNNNGCEQDSSLNTTADTNTISSSSSRTVKIINDHQQAHGSIGTKLIVQDQSSKH